MRTIFIIEDSESWVESWKEELNMILPDVTVVSALTIDEALRKISEGFENLVCVILDACVPGDEPNTGPLLAVLLKLYPEVPVVAASSLNEYTAELMHWGATHGVKKHAVVITVVNILNKS